MRTPDLEKLLKAKYTANGYAVFFNVADGTGATQHRFADAIAINLWPSRGLEIEGFELKVSRSDWQRELGKPAKAEAVFKFCDRWTIVAGDKDIVREGELPPTWGLMVADGRGLNTIAKPPKLTPLPLTRSFVAAIARRAMEQGADAQAMKDAYESGRASGLNNQQHEMKRLQETAERVQAFREATGIDLSATSYGRFHWHDPKQIGAAVLQVLREGDGVLSQMKQLRDYAERVAAEVNEILGDRPAKAPAKGRKRA